MKGFLSGNQLKIIAMVTMTLDHIGLQLLPQYPILRVVGRLALPIYAYLIAQGCRHTHSPKGYLGRLLGLGLLCQAVYYFAMDSLYQGILVTFSLSAAIIFTSDQALKTKKTAPLLLALGTGAGAVFACVVLPGLLPGTDYGVDYGLLGVMLPVCAYFWRLPGLTGCMILMGLETPSQWWALAAVPILAAYNGRRGKWNMGRFFYFYYPAHLVIIYAISLFV